MSNVKKIEMDSYRISKRSYWILGKEEEACHIKLQNPTCSKIHMVIQFKRTFLFNDEDEIGKYIISGQIILWRRGLFIYLMIIC